MSIQIRIKTVTQIYDKNYKTLIKNHKDKNKTPDPKSKFKYEDH